MNEKDALDILQEKLESSIAHHKMFRRKNPIDYALGKSVGHIRAYNTVLLWIEELKKECEQKQ